MLEHACPENPVPVVRAIVRDAAGRVLILKRQNAAYGCDAWCLPGGKVDYLESVEACVARELNEETGLRLTSARFLFYHDGLPARRGRMHCVVLYFECEAEGELALNDESSDAAWVGPADLDRYEFAFQSREMLERYWSSHPRARDGGASEPTES